MEVNDSEGTLIPAGEDIAHFDVDEQLAWVLVVEKEVRVYHDALTRDIFNDVEGRLSNSMPAQRCESHCINWARPCHHRVYLFPRSLESALTSLYTRARDIPM